MKGKIVRGSGFGGVLRYVLDADKKAYILGGNMLGRDAKGLAREFGPVRQLRPDCKKPVLHISLRLPGGEDVTDLQWLRIAVRLMKLMKLSQTRPWVLVKHLGEHIHLVTSRVDYQGQVWTGEWEALRLIEATQILEKEFGLRITPGLKGANRKQVRLTSGQLRKISREVERGDEPEIPAKVAIAERIEKALVESNGSFPDFKARLEKLGVAVKLNTAKTSNHISGVTFEYAGIAMKGSKVARAYSWQGLQELLAERKYTNENPGIAQPSFASGPEPDDRRADQPKPTNRSQRAGPARNRPPKRSIPTPPRITVVVPGDGNRVAGAVPDLLLALLARTPVATAVGAIAGPVGPTATAIIAEPGEAGVARGRDSKNLEEDDDQVLKPDGPTMSS